MNTILVGNGYFGSLYRERLLAHDEYTLVGLVDSNTDRLTKDVPTHAMTLPHLLDNMDCDTVVICTPPSTHYELASQALLADKNVFLAKPGGMSYMEAAMLHGLARQRDVALGIDYTPLWAPEANAVDQQIAMLGEPTFFRSERRVCTPPREEGIILDLLSHDAAIYHYLVMHKPKTVRCWITDWVCNAEITAENGCAATMIAAYNERQPIKRCAFTLDGASNGITNPSLRIEWDQQSRSVSVRTQMQRVSFHFRHVPDPISRSLDDFASWSHNPAYKTVHETRHLWVMRLLEALQQSANEHGNEVDV